MQVSDSISYSPPVVKKKRRKSEYGDGAIWSELTSKGTRVWKVEVTIGRSQDGTTKKTRRTAHSKAEAIKIRRELNSLKLQGVLEKQKVRVLLEFSEHWLSEVKPHQVRETTLSDYRFRLNKYIYPYLGTLAVREITPHQIHNWVNTLTSQGLGTNTVNGARRILFGVMRHAQRQGVISTNPVSATDALKQKPDEPTQVRPHWSLAECQQALRQASTWPEMDLFLHLAIYLGFRHGEILGLRWRDVDLTGNVISVNHTLRGLSRLTTQGTKLGLVLNPPKTESSRRTLTIPPKVKDAIIRHQTWQASRMAQKPSEWPESDMVFTTSVGTPIDQTNNLKKFKSFIMKNGLRYIRVHDLRHSSAVMALEAGATIESISQALGHSGIEITKTVYAPYVQALNDRFVSAMDEYLGSSKSASDVTRD